MKLHGIVLTVTQVQALHRQNVNYSYNYIVIPQPQTLVGSQ